jgi:hypothetical protein
MVTKAEHSHKFEVADMEHFQAFADWLTEHLPKAEVTFHDKPFFGRPWIQIDQRENMDRWTLMLDEGHTFNVGNGEAWITVDANE